MEIIRNIKSYLLQLKDDSLLSNGFYVFSSSIVTAIGGLVFWKLMTFYHTDSTVGYLSSLISMVGWASLLSKFSFDLGLRRYIAEYNREEKINFLNTIANFVGISSIIGGITTILVMMFFISGYQFIKYNFLIIPFFVLFVVITSIVQTQEAAFIGLRDSEYRLIGITANTINKLILVVIFFFANLELLVFILTLAIFINLLINTYYLLPKSLEEYKPNLSLDTTFIKNIFPFSMGNFVSTLISTQLLLLPVIIVTILGAEQAAYFYIVYVLSTMLYRIPASFGNSFMVEAVHDKTKVVHFAKKTIFIIIIIIVAANLFFFIFGKFLLGIFGSNYSKYGYPLLIVMSITAFPVTITHLFNSYQYYLGRTKLPVLIQFIRVITILVGTFLFLSDLGLLAIGYSFLLGNIIIAVPILIYMINRVGRKLLGKI